MEIIRMCDMAGDIRPEISKLFVDGFHKWLQFFSKDKGKLIGAFAHSFNFEVFYAAVIAGKIVGMIACTDGRIPSMRLSKTEFKRHLGWLRGTIAYVVLKKEFEEKKYPFAVPADMGLIEFVAVSGNHRGEGVATAILRHIHENTPYVQYALEVADTNTTAMNLYEKLGYREFLRISQAHSDKSGVNALVYMKYEKSFEPT